MSRQSVEVQYVRLLHARRSFRKDAADDVDEQMRGHLECGTTFISPTDAM